MNSVSNHIHRIPMIVHQINPSLKPALLRSQSKREHFRDVFPCFHSTAFSATFMIMGTESSPENERHHRHRWQDYATSHPIDDLEKVILG